MKTLNRWLRCAAASSVITVSSLISSQAVAQSPLLAPAPALPNSTSFKPSVSQATPGLTTITELPVAVPTTSAPAKDLPNTIQQSVPATTAPAAPCTECASGFDFSKTPEIRPVPRPGNFPVPPSGCGFYSMLDHMRGDLRDAPPKYGYPPFALMQGSFFNADFRYLDDPANTDFDYADCLKRIKLGDNWMFSTGGQAQTRFMNETDSRLTTRTNSYDLTRVRAYGDLWYKDEFRIYAEFISATSTHQNLSALPIDSNPADFLNLFMEIKLAEFDGHNIYARIGRQELLLGSQRLISPLEWANTRRTFQGVDIYRTGEKWDTNFFWVQPVIIDTQNFDHTDNNQNFAGLWTTYRPKKGTSADFYYLFLDNTNKVTQSGVARAPTALHTFGSRYAGDKDGFLWDFEGAMQLGTNGKQNVVAGMATAGLGYNFKSAPWNPTFWVYYDYASGNNGKPGVGSTDSTFNQLYPFGHYYLGWIDLVGRQNIQDVNLQFWLYPTNWVTLYGQYHHFWLASPTDALYNAAGNVLRIDPTGKAGNNVGDEVDITANFHLSKHSDILTGYSKLFGGQFLDQTKGKTGAKDSSLFYLMYNYKW